MCIVCTGFEDHRVRRHMGRRYLVEGWVWADTRPHYHTHGASLLERGLSKGFEVTSLTSMCNKKGGVWHDE